MGERYGVILLDGAEIILTVYQQMDAENTSIVSHQSRDLTTFNKSPISSFEIIEHITDLLLIGHKERISNWQLCARNITTDTVTQIQHAINLSIEQLTLQREQYLLSTAICGEMLHQ